MIFDTDVLIWFLRGNENAADAVVNSIPFSISIVTYMELLQGMRNKQEMETMKKAFKEMEVNVIPISEGISTGKISAVSHQLLAAGRRQLQFGMRNGGTGGAEAIVLRQ